MIPSITEVIKHYPEFTGVHEACLAVPMVSEEDFGAIVADIQQNGLREPLLRSTDRKLLDGRTRLLACYECQQDIRVKDDLIVSYPNQWICHFSCIKVHCVRDLISKIGLVQPY